MEKTKTFKVEFTERAVKQLHKLDKQKFLIIVNWIKKNLEGCENPRLHGKALTANNAGKWRYRIGDYRLICLIKDNKLIILAMTVGHRRDIYER